MPYRMAARCAWLPLAALVVFFPRAAEPQDDAAEHLGKQVFTTGSEPACSICHALSDAGATGEIGPNLDDLRPTAEQVHRAVTDGVGIMPSYKETLSAEEIAALSEYVAESAGQTQ
jgi:mono/diheme cytochrome c family protein